MLVIDSGRISLDIVSCRRDCSAPSPCLTGAGSSDKAQRASKHEPLSLELGPRSPGKSAVLKVSEITRATAMKSQGNCGLTYSDHRVSRHQTK